MPNLAKSLADSAESSQVVGPASATDNAVARYDGATGKLLQNSLVTIADNGDIALPALRTVDGRDVSVDGAALDTAVTNIAANTAAIALLQGYRWTWAGAAARSAQTDLSASLVGAVGYQADMDLSYRLLSVSPTRWGRLEDASMVTVGTLLCNAAGNQFQLGTNILNVQSGSFAARALTNTNKATARLRSAYNTGSVAGNTAYARATGGQQTLHMAHGWRYRICCGPGAVTADMRWVYGMYDILGSNVNQAPTVVVNAIAIGADGGNLTIYTNDGAGAASALDLGASFPGVTAGNIYEVEFYSPEGSDVRYQVLNLATGAEVSGVISSNIPTAATAMNHGLFATNNASAVAVSADLGSIIIQQRSR